MKKIFIATILMTAMFAASALATPVVTLTAGVTGSASIQCTKDSDCNPQILTLCTKDTATYKCDGRATATLTFNPTGAPWSLTTIGNAPTTETEYALIYYYDTGATPKPWNGDANGKIIATFAWPYNGAIAVHPVDLPILGDYNNAPNPLDDYCLGHNGFDSYAHCNGAKLWIVPVSDLTNGNLPLTAFDANALFETDLIRYQTESIVICNQSNQCEFKPRLCGLSATGNPAFDTMTPGTTFESAIYTTVTNTGNVPVTPEISGTDWTPYMPVGATTWSLPTPIWTPLTKTPTTIGQTLSTTLGDTASVYYELTVPAGQPAASYSQTITYTANCDGIQT